MPTPNTRSPTTWSGNCRVRALLGSALALAPWIAAAQDAAPFDRPGIGFATEVLDARGFAWEQGLPDFSSDRSDGVETRQYVLDSRLRLGLGAGLELQIASDSYNWQRGSVQARGGGDSSASLKWQLPGSGERFGWAVLGTYGLDTGRAPFSDEGASRELGVTASWALASQRAIGIYLDYLDAPAGHVWTFSPSVTCYDDGRLAAYVEAGFGAGSERERVAGGGLTWRWRPQVQLDASLLRGLSQDSTDWQAGVGVSIALQ